MQRPSMALLAGVTAFSRQAPLQVCAVVCPGIWQRGLMRNMPRLITAYWLEHQYPEAHPRSVSFLIEHLWLLILWFGMSTMMSGI